MLVIRTPARWAMEIPVPIAQGQLVECRYPCPTPPVASTVKSARWGST